MAASEMVRFPVAFFTRSYYSLLKGVVSPGALPALLQGLGYESALLADRDALSGAPAFFRSAVSSGIKAIVGVELTDDTEKTALLVIRNREGFEAASTILTKRNLEDGFTLAGALRDIPEGLFVVAGCTALAEDLSADLSPRQLGLMLLRPCRSVSCEKRRFEAARRLNLSLYAACRFVYPSKQDLDTGRVLKAIDRRALLKEVAAEGEGEVFLSARRMAELFRDSPGALSATESLASECCFSWKQRRYVVPKVPFRLSEPSSKFLGNLAREGLRRREGASGRAVERLDRELEEISRLGLEDYFLVVWDIVTWAKKRGVVCVCRGSGAGSLVSFALGLSPVNPLEAGLLFERFLNRLRPDLPDLDLDLDWTRRDEVVSSVYKRYGPERVAMIGSYVTFRPRLAFREAARVSGLPPQQVDELGKMLPFSPRRTGMKEVISATPRARFVKWDSSPLREIVSRSERLLSLPRNLTIHPAGIVISDREVCRYVPLVKAPKGIVVTQLDMDGVEESGLIKIDLLGNRALGELGEASRLVKARHGKEIQLRSLPAEDKETAGLLEKANTIGCFQIESPAMRQLIKSLRSRNWPDLLIAMSLIRPGPAASGAKERFIRIVNGAEKPRYIHPGVERALAKTWGVLVFEEDLMRVYSGITGRPLSEGELLRKRIKQAGENEGKLEPVRKSFIEAASANGVASDAASLIWKEFLRFASYTYNKAHAAVFSRIGWAMAYIKAHFPEEFFCAVLNHHGGMYPARVLLSEARREGTGIRCPCVNRSQRHFVLEGKALRIPLSQVRNLSESTCRKILKRRPFRNLKDFLNRVNPPSNEAENLLWAGAFDFTGVDRPKLIWELNISRKRPGAKEREKYRQAELPVALSYPSLPELSIREKAAREIPVLDFSPSGNALKMVFHDLAGEHGLTEAGAVQLRGKGEVVVMGLLGGFREVPSEGGNRMAFLSLQDHTGWNEVVLFPDVYKKVAWKIRGAGPYLVHGRVKEHFGSVHVQGHEVERVNPLAGSA